MGSPFLLSKKCDALLEPILLRSIGSISQCAEAPFGRAKVKVHRTLWLLSALTRPSVVPKPRSTGPCGTRLAYSDISINFSLSECSFYYLRSALYFLNSYYFAVILYNYLLQTSIIYQLLS